MYRVTTPRFNLMEINYSRRQPFAFNIRDTVNNTYQNIYFMKRKFIYLSLVVLAGVLLIYSCSSNKAKVNPTPSTPAATVAIQNFAFVPDTVRIKAGNSIKWTNMDTAPHTATDLANAFDSGSLATGQTFNFTFNTTGTFTYHCLIHSMMKNAVVIVSN